MPNRKKHCFNIVFLPIHPTGPEICPPRCQVCTLEIVLGNRTPSLSDPSSRRGRPTVRWIAVDRPDRKLLSLPKLSPLEFLHNPGSLVSYGLETVLRLLRMWGIMFPFVRFLWWGCLPNKNKQSSYTHKITQTISRVYSAIELGISNLLILDRIKFNKIINF